ncbi:SDR family NAD(P)-dependent oxidoreductase [Geomicrobium sp. JCM 19038]|uniref:SDR family NAD(P)-dependent oxidoreductase n=1 Tax=Geomicrobium sp. JCM 19038 TaxID=1460635 RepID=UPI00045F2217|nr:SDR family oxidoreductase [Geomicrobium sp. JCM 19038]GAK09725.1 3-oxoacyl-[acyl-carrier protein] reductase [Geomicrobium sp. JCM 19038]
MVFSNDALQNEHIVVTGATGGIGYETAILVAKLGASVTVTGRNEKKLKLLGEELRKHTENYFVKRTDIAVEEERQGIVSTAEEKLGPITGLVNAAGIAGNYTVEEVTAEQLHDFMELNYVSLVMLSKLVYRSMKANKKGAIVNVSSLSGLRGTYANTAYSASKFAVIGFTQSFALEAIEYGVRVNAVAPGIVDTEMGRAVIERKAAQQGRTYSEQKQRTEDTYPTQKLITPQEVARTIVYLLTDATKSIVGETVKISSGSLMR